LAKALGVGEQNGVIDCEVLTVEPHKRLAYSWNSSREEAADGLNTVVTWTLTPANGGTHLRMVQSGFRPEDEAGYQRAGYGWRGSSTAWNGWPQDWTDHRSLAPTFSRRGPS
jgi:uncharacterized protein YndB with AHSA1/START domain